MNSSDWGKVTENIKITKSSRSRTLRISIDRQDVKVSAPKYMHDSLIQQFITDHQNWILTHLEHFEEKKQRLGLASNTVLLFGQQKKIHFKLSGENIGVRESETELEITPIQPTLSSIQKQLDRYLKAKITHFLSEELPRMSQLMKTSFSTFHLKKQSTRWGSCSSQGNLNFNLSLVHAPVEIIRYVVIHELAHRTHMNHSPAFWRLVEQFDQEYRIHRGWLKRHGASATWYELQPPQI